jgi:hypothetical protein
MNPDVFHADPGSPLTMLLVAARFLDRANEVAPAY